MSISRRGFGSMRPEKQRRAASKGGYLAHKKKVAHEWDQEAARAAGRKGGLASARLRIARALIAKQLQAQQPATPLANEPGA